MLSEERLDGCESDEVTVIASRGFCRRKERVGW